MGLDMYLDARKYLSRYSSPELKESIEKLLGVDEFNLTPNLGGGVSGVVLRAAYWRKANAIHKWFVDKVQNGEDNCAEYYVGREKLSDLLQLAKDVLSGEKGADELPPCEGFFFGVTDDPEAYKADLQDTVKQLTDALKLPDEWEFFYHSSW